MKRYLIVFVMTGGLVFTAGIGWAHRAYVTDSFQITLRTGPSTENKIVSLLPSGQSLEVISSEGDWSHVRVLKGEGSETEGWVLSRYLITRQPWEIQTRSLKEKIKRISERLAQIERDLAEKSRRERNVTGELVQKSQILDKLQKEYGTLKRESGGYLQLKALYKATALALENNKATVRRLRKENESLRSSNRNRWFATGALVILCGLMIGITVGRQQRKRKSLLY